MSKEYLKSNQFNMQNTGNIFTTEFIAFVGINVFLVLVYVS